MTEKLGLLSGDWEAAEQRAAAGPDEEAGSDDEVFGDFEDVEAGMLHVHSHALSQSCIETEHDWLGVFISHFN